MFVPHIYPPPEDNNPPSTPKRSYFPSSISHLAQQITFYVYRFFHLFTKPIVGAYQSLHSYIISYNAKPTPPNEEKEPTEKSADILFKNLKVTTPFTTTENPDNSDDEEFYTPSPSPEETSPFITPCSTPDEFAPQPPLFTLAELKKAEALNRLINALPGKALMYESKRAERVTFREHLMKTLFRKEEIRECTFDDQTKQFTLTYESDKIVHCSKLPEAVEMSYFMSSLVNALLAIAPGVQLSQCLQVKIKEVPQGIQILFEKNKIFLTENRFNYTAHLASIVVVEDLQSNGGCSLFIKIDHNSKHIPKSGPVDHQLFAEALDLNFFPEA